MTYQWTTPIRYVRGLGPVRAKELTKIGIETVGNLLEYHPLHHLYPGGVSIAEAKEGYVVLKGRIGRICLDYNQNVRAQIGDDTGVCEVVWYNARYVCDQLHAGMTVTLWGKYKCGLLQQPRWSTCEASMKDVYGGVYGVHHSTIRAALKEVLCNTALGFMHDGTVRIAVFNAFHFPEDKAHQQWALKMLKFDEALQLSLALQERRRGREGVKGVVILI